MSNNNNNKSPLERAHIWNDHTSLWELEFKVTSRRIYHTDPKTFHKTDQTAVATGNWSKVTEK